MEKVLVDTDILIDFLRGYEKRVVRLFQNIHQKKVKGYISLITIAELYAGADVEDERKVLALTKLLSFFKTVPLTLSIVKKAGKLKRIHTVGLADGLIAATALEEKVPLLTFNTKHFKKISELRLYTLYTDRH